MKNHCRGSVGFSFRATLWFLWPAILFTRSFLRSMLSFNLLAVFTFKCNDSVSFSFLSPCFFSLLRTKIASFQLKQNNHCVFELSVPCVCLFHYVIATEFDYRIQYNYFRVALHAADSLSIKHELRLKKIKQVFIMQTFPNTISRFAT